MKKSALSLWIKPERVKGPSTLKVVKTNLIYIKILFQSNFKTKYYIDSKYSELYKYFNKFKHEQ